MTTNKDKFLEVIKKVEKGSKIAVEMHESPDPDSLGIAYAISGTLQKLDLESTIIYTGAISDEMNKQMVKALGIPCKNYKCNGIKPDDFRYFIFVDHDGRRSQWMKEGLIPADKILAQFDHHEINDEHPKSLYTDIRQMGSSSTIFAEYLMDGLEDILDERELVQAATGLFLGLITDTDDLKSKTATPKDWDVHRWLRGKVDMDLVYAVQDPPWSPRNMTRYGKAIKDRLTRGSITLATVGILEEEEDRDIVPRVADHLKREKGTTTVFAYGITPDKFDFSIRTSDSTFNYDKLKAKFPGCSAGGKTYVGGMQIPNMFRADTLIKFTKENYDKIEKLAWEEFEKALLPPKES